MGGTYYDLLFWNMELNFHQTHSLFICELLQALVENMLMFQVPDAVQCDNLVVHLEHRNVLHNF